MPYTRKRRKLHSGESARRQSRFDPGPWIGFRSSRVSRARYDPDNQVLEVDWVDGGLSYVYYDVPPNIWRNMQRVKSLGKFVNRVLNQYEYAPKVD
jgi:hypothetical protein